MKDTTRIERNERIWHLHFDCHVTKSELAKMLGLTYMQISRIIAQAQEKGTYDHTK